MWQSAMTWTNSPGSKPETWAIIMVRTEYWTTFQLFAASISCERWFRMALSLLPVTLKVME